MRHPKIALKSNLNRMNIKHSNESQRMSVPLVAFLSSSLILIFNKHLLVQAQCPINTMTSFERISGVTVKGSQLTLLYTAPNITHPSPLSGSATELTRQLGSSVASLMSIPITAECNNRCRRSIKCRAFLVDYARHTCYSIESNMPNMAAGLLRAPQPIQLEPTQERTSYFEKVCLNLPFVECERAWVFERVSAHHINGHDDKIIEDVPTRIKCQEYCLNEQEFRCRSGEYDYLTMQCRLSMADRHLKPKSFHLTRSNVDYFENQCVPVGNQCDAFDRYEDMDLGRAEIMRPANTSDQCQQLCTQTIKAFICRSFTWNPLTGKCYLNSMNSNMAGGLDKLLRAPGLTYYQRNDCIDLKLECDTTAMTLNLRTNEPFRGRMYVRDDPNACETIGRSSSLISSLSIPFQSHSRCATRELPSRYSSVVVVQQHPMIQRKSDRYIKVVCDFQTANKTITSTYNVIANAWTSTALINATSFAPKIKLRITDKYGIDITGAKLGDELYLRIEAESDSVYDMVARSVLAKSGLTEESIMLIDKDGCPTDFRIFPPLKKLNRKTIVGKFDAFKFSSDVVVRFQVDVQFCLNQCPATSCDHNLLLTNSQAAQLDQYSADGLSSTVGGQPGSTTITPTSPLGLDTSLETAASSTQAPAPFLARTSPATPTNNNQIHHHQPKNFTNTLLHYPDSASIPEPPYRHPSLPANLPASYLHGNNSTSLNSLMPSSAGGDSQIFEQSRNANQQPEGKSAEENTGKTVSGSDGQQLQSLDNAEQASLTRNKSNNQQNPDQQRRRRRSAEPLPEAPSHVPLQREIIVEGGSSGGDSQNNNKIQQSAIKKSRNKKPGEQREPRKGDERAAESSSARGGLSNHLPPEINGSHKVDQIVKEGQYFDSSTGAASTMDSQTDPLLCTTRNSLVFATVAFCTVQFLTIALCLITWLHKKDAIKFKVRPFPAEQRFY